METVSVEAPLYEYQKPDVDVIGPEFLEVHEVPSDELRINPEEPTTMKRLLRNFTSLSVFEVPEFLEVYDIPSDEVRMIPELPTATNVLFAKVTPKKVFETPAY